MPLQDTIYRLSISVPPSSADAFARAIEPHVDSVAWTASEGIPKAKITGFAEGPPNETDISTAVAITAVSQNVLEPDITIERIPVRNWVVENIKQFPPETVARWFIYGADFRGTVPAGKLGLRIPAGGAFGSGDHGTTRGCMLAMDELQAETPRRILDMGCGSGILGIAAAKMWRVPVTASDIDPVATRISRENIAANRVGNLVRAHHATGYRHPEIRRHKYDLIISNILARPLMRMARDLVRQLAPGGTVILSGLLESDGNRVHTAHAYHGLRLQRRIFIDGWVTLVLKAP